MDDAGIIPLFHVQDFVLVRPHVKGFRMLPVGQPALTGIKLNPSRVTRDRVLNVAVVGAAIPNVSFTGWREDRPCRYFAARGLNPQFPGAPPPCYHPLASCE